MLILEDIILVPHVAHAAHITQRAVLYAIQDGDVPAPSRVGRLYLWPREKLPEILAGLTRRHERQCQRTAMAQ